MLKKGTSLHPISLSSEHNSGSTNNFIVQTVTGVYFITFINVNRANVANSALAGAGRILIGT